MLGRDPTPRPPRWARPRLLQSRRLKPDTNLHRVVPLLEGAGHEAIAVDLPGDDARAGLSVYADRVREAIGTREVILVAQSLGGFTAALVCDQARVRMLVFVNAMIPVPGESAGEWWVNTGWEGARVAAAQRGG